MAFIGPLLTKIWRSVLYSWHALPSSRQNKIGQLAAPAVLGNEIGVETHFQLPILLTQAEIDLRDRGAATG